MDKALQSNKRAKFEFRNDIFEIIIGGKSSIDAHTAFHVSGMKEADQFILSYGYDLENPIERAEILGNFREALNFIRKNFLQPDNPDGLRVEIPKNILELSDIRELFVMAGQEVQAYGTQPRNQLLKDWACSILKVMHTIAHIDKDLRASYFAEIQKQIFDRFYKVIHRDLEGNLFLGDKLNDPLRVNLVAFEIKPKKTRDSIILKLLHKPENVAEDIFDQVGIRFITPTPFQALRVIKYLKDKMIVIPSNIKPSRSRNTLIELSNFRKHLNELVDRFDCGEISESQLESQLELIAHFPPNQSMNPHSSEFYRAIQFTCRQLIKLRNPIFDDIKELKALVKAKPLDDSLVKAIEKIDLKYTQREVRFFYPYEVQIVDQQSAEENEKGKSAHREYKRAQVITAMKRILKPFIGT